MPQFRGQNQDAVVLEKEPVMAQLSEKDRGRQQAREDARKLGLAWMQETILLWGHAEEEEKNSDYVKGYLEVFDSLVGIEKE